MPHETPGPDADSALEWRLRRPRHRVERRALGWWTVRALLVLVPSVAALTLTATLVPSARLWLVPALIGVSVLGTLYTIVVPRWRYRVHGWEATDDAVYTVSGWLKREWRAAPMYRIQTVDTDRGPLQLLFRLSSVTVTTASAAGALTIDGLDHEVAAQLVDQLTASAQSSRGDAT